MPHFPMGVSSAETGGSVPCGHLAVSPEIDLSLHLHWSLLLLPMEKPLCPLDQTSLRAGSLGWWPAWGQLASWDLVGGSRDLLGVWRLREAGQAAGRMVTLQPPPPGQAAVSQLGHLFTLRGWGRPNPSTVQV